MARFLLTLSLVALYACAPPRNRTVATGPSKTAVQPSPVASAAPTTTTPKKVAAEHRTARATEPKSAKPSPKPDAAPIPTPTPAQPKRPPHPLAGLTEKELERKLLQDPTSLGSMSIGRTAGGALFNGVQMPKGKHWRVVNPKETWGTRETVESLARAIKSVNRQHKKTPPLRIGDISKPAGGTIRPHISHQSGRDVDAGYYYTDSGRWYSRATKRNLDLPRTWSLVKALVIETDVERLFIDISIQRLLKAYALAQGEDPAWVDSVFGGKLATQRPIVKHIAGHSTHVHIRFYNPIAQRTGRMLYKLLIAHKKIEPPTQYMRYKVRRGDTLSRLARRYKTTVRKLRRANRLRSTRILTGRTYKIPKRGGVALGPELVVPPRRLPPPKATATRAASRSATE